MNITRLVGAATALFMTGVTAAVAAPTTTFAQAKQDVTGNQFQFTNTGATSTFTTIGSIPVDFQYYAPNSYGAVLTTIPATLNFSAVAAAPAQTLGSVVDQSLKNVNLTLTALTPVGGKTNLLSATSSAGDLTGLLGGGSGTEFSSTPTDNIGFTSDFIDLTGSTDRNFAFSFSSINPNLSLAQNGYLSGFTAAGTGTFASNFGTPVPEPAANASLALGGLGLLGLMLRARKTRRANGSLA